MVCVLVIGTALAIEMLIFKRSAGSALRALGFGWPSARALFVALLVCGLLLAFFPAFAMLTGSRLALRAIKLVLIPNDVFLVAALGWMVMCGLAPYLVFVFRVQAPAPEGESRHPQALLKNL